METLKKQAINGYGARCQSVDIRPAPAAPATSGAEDGSSGKIAAKPRFFGRTPGLFARLGHDFAHEAGK
ncbi:MAG: hypothetical protein WCJ64_14450 [Rhodospirillaceae bacterium]